MGRLDRAVDRVEQFAADCAEIDGVPEPHGERCDCRLGVVAGAVEAPVDHVLHAPAERVEQRRRSERGRGDGDRRRERQHIGGENDDPDEDPDQEAAQERVVGRPDSPADAVRSPLRRSRRESAQTRCRSRRGSRTALRQPSTPPSRPRGREPHAATQARNGRIPAQAARTGSRSQRSRESRPRAVP
jgi:hypothetical protein